MLSKFISSKRTIPHPIILAKFDARPLFTTIIFYVISLLRRFHCMLDMRRYSYLALQSSIQLANQGTKNYWYAQTTTLLQFLGLYIKRPPPTKSSINTPYFNKDIRDGIYLTYIKTTWTDPKEPLLPKMLHYSKFYLQLENGLITTPKYNLIHISQNFKFSLAHI